MGEVGVVNPIVVNGESLQFVTLGLREASIITIHNTKGQLMHTQQVEAEEGRVEIELPNLSTGVYIYSIKTATQKFFGKFVKK